MDLLRATIMKLNEITTVVENKSSLTEENESFIKEIFVASMALDAYFVSSELAISIKISLL